MSLAVLSFADNAGRGRRFLALGLALACLNACTVGPNYKIPKTALVNAPGAQAKFMGTDDPVLSNATAVSGPWWRLYDIPLLDALERQAFTANTNLRVAAANLQRSRAMVEEARAARQPTLAANFDPSYAQLSAESYLSPELIPAQGLYDSGLTLSYELDLFGRITRGIEAAKAEDESVEAALDAARISVAAETIRAYADVCGSGGELAVAEHSLALQQQGFRLTQQLVAAGREGELDLVRSNTQVEQFRANVPALRTRRQNALYRLAVLTGRPPSEYPRDLSDCRVAPRLNRPIPTGDGVALLRRRPDVREAERRLAAATARIGIATAALYPTIGFGISAGSSGAINDFLTDPTNRWGLGPIIRWQLNQSVPRARIKQAEAAASAELARFDGTVLSALRDIESSLNLYVNDLRRDQSLRAAQSLAYRAERDAELLYRSGRVGFLNLLDAERVSASADSALAASSTAIANDQISIFLALGGGWEDADRLVTVSATEGSQQKPRVSPQ